MQNRKLVVYKSKLTVYDVSCHFVFSDHEVIRNGGGLLLGLVRHHGQHLDKFGKKNLGRIQVRKRTLRQAGNHYKPSSARIERRTDFEP